jgi:dihydrofolate synthase / folylpolyglutamate synthase
MISYDTAVAHLYELGHELAATPSRKFDLEHVRVLLDAIGHPERRFTSVLIAGTNGKGSTAAMLASILRAAGYKTGLYTSPHLLCINERLQINNVPTDDARFAATYEAVETKAQQLIAAGRLPWHPSFFEMLTAMCMQYFAEEKVQIAVLEVGMGGRLDATNAVEPCLSIITDISLDHQKFLGNTIAEIAREKAGIVRRNRPIVLLPQHPEANDVLGRAIIEAEAKAVSAAKYVPMLSPGAEGLYQRTADRTQFHMTVRGEDIEIDTSLSGRHQLRNIALAITAAEELASCGFPVAPKQIEQGLRETRWPGRFQVVPPLGERPEIVFDVAHNPAGAWALRAALTERYPDRRLIVVFGAMRDKAISEIASILFPTAEKVIATHAGNNPRAASAEEIAAAAERTGAEVLITTDMTTALDRAFSEAKADKNALIVITGSIYVVGEAMRILGVRAT